MGFECSWWGQLEVREGKLEELNKLLQSDLEYFRDFGVGMVKTSRYVGPNKTVPGEELQICNNGRYHEDEWSDFVAKILPYVKGRITFDGDEDSHWCYDLKDGEWEELNGEIVYGELFDAFMREYDQKLPDDLKQQLQMWQCANKI